MSHHTSATKKPRILIVSNPGLPVPPTRYGGTERIVWYVASGLAERGYAVTLMASEGSLSPGRLITFPARSSSRRMIRALAKANFWATLVRELPRHDLVHSAASVQQILPALRWRIPKLLNFQFTISPHEIAFVRRHARGPIALTACGARMIEPHRDEQYWRPVHNAVPVLHYDFSPRPHDPPYLAFLGRFVPEKGAHTAIHVARRTGMKLKIAGNCTSPYADPEYFEHELKPYIDGKTVEYVGELDDEGKAKLLGGAAALLNPIEWEEPFGIVMAESLACGTPVVSFDRGEVRNIIKHGVTGFICADKAAMEDGVARIGSISRARCRADAERHFDTSRMLDEIEEIYRWLLAAGPRPAEWQSPARSDGARAAGEYSR